MRYADPSSMTSEPRLTASGANALLTDDDAEMNVTSTSLNESGVASCTFNSVSAYGSCLPCERLDANARIFSGGWLRSDRSSNATVPTAPVAPTIAILRLDDDDDCIVAFFQSGYSLVSYVHGFICVRCWFSRYLNA